VEVGAVVSATGRYAVQGSQMRLGLELWAGRAGARLVLADDGSSPERAARLHEELRASGYRFVLGPYGSDSARAVALARGGAVVWNHGAAADDVQRLPGVVSVPSPASGYLTAAARILPAGCRLAVVAARGPFARFAVEELDLELAGRFSFADSPAAVAELRPEAVLACGPVEREVALFHTLRPLLPGALLGGVSPGLAAFPEALGGDPEGFLAPVQWHPDLGGEPELGPTSAEVVAQAGGPLDYVAAQAYAACLIAERCIELDPGDPLGAARGLQTTTFFGAFELAPDGLQIAHQLAVVQWRRGQQKLLTASSPG